MEKVDLLKTDVDCYESKVLNGGLQTIRKHKPIIILELGLTLERVGDKLADLIGALNRLRYSFYSVKSGEKYDEKQIAELVKQERTFDCLCLAGSN